MIHTVLTRSTKNFRRLIGKRSDKQKMSRFSMFLMESNQAMLAGVDLSSVESDKVGGLLASLAMAAAPLSWLLVFFLA
jgi:hypothetical protein